VILRKRPFEKGAVSAKAIKSGAVGSGALATDALTAPAIALGSVYGGSLGEVTVHLAPIVDGIAFRRTLSDGIRRGNRNMHRGRTGPFRWGRLRSPGQPGIGTFVPQPFMHESGNGRVGPITTNAGAPGTPPKAEVEGLPQVNPAARSRSSAGLLRSANEVGLRPRYE
jgi:hypothetical protein